MAASPRRLRLPVLRDAPFGLPGGAVCLAAAAVLLWSVSVPGVHFFTYVGAVGVLLLAGLVEAVRFTVARVRRRPWSWRWLAAPITALVLLALVWTDAPLEARWALSRGAFWAAVADLPPATAGHDELDVPSRIGSYSVTGARRVPGGVVFDEATGDLVDNAGFAYLPAGPTPDLEAGGFEAPMFQHLGGPWYAWVASW